MIFVGEKKKLFFRRVDTMEDYHQINLESISKGKSYSCFQNTQNHFPDLDP